MCFANIGMFKISVSMGDVDIRCRKECRIHFFRNGLLSQSMNTEIFAWQNCSKPSILRLYEYKKAKFHQPVFAFLLFSLRHGGPPWLSPPSFPSNPSLPPATVRRFEEELDSVSHYKLPIYQLKYMRIWHV